MSKMNDRYRRNVDEGYQKVVILWRDPNQKDVQISQLYQKIGACRQKTEGERLWNELTKTITQLRKSLSKLESHAYEELTNRFERSTMTKSGNSSSCPSQTENVLFTMEQDFPPMKPLQDPLPELLPPSELTAAGDCEPFEMEPEDPASRFPLPVYLRIGETIRAKVLHVISPLEIYVIRKDDLERLEDVERVLDTCSDEIRLCPLTNETCVPEAACAALIDGEVKRAVIRMKGTKEVQVYLVDYGRTQFLPRVNVFMLPKTLSTMAPPLAHYCTLADIDNNQLDQTLVNKFVEAVIKKGELILRAHGSNHRLYGELVDILQQKKKLKKTEKTSPSFKPSGDL